MTRPADTKRRREYVKRKLEQGVPVSQIASETRVSVSTIQRDRYHIENHVGEDKRLRKKELFLPIETVYEYYTVGLYDIEELAFKVGVCSKTLLTRLREYEDERLKHLLGDAD